MELTKETIVGAAILLVLGLIIGVLIGQPYPVSLEDWQRNTLISDCENSTERLERSHAREITKQEDDFLDRLKDFAKSNRKCLEDSKEIDKGWQRAFDDLNATVWKNYADLNKTIYDFNVNCS